MAGKSILSGCGSDGIMGSCYNAAKTLSRKDINGKPQQNLVIVTEPLWGDEDLENCTIISSAKSEAQRIGFL